jgi:hypothetical protein
MDEPVSLDAVAESIAKQWTFLNNHAHVLICLARRPDAVLREVSQWVGITERATQKIIKDLVDSQVLQRHRDGRRNRYRINYEQPLRHPLERQHSVGNLLAMFLTSEEMARNDEGGKVLLFPERLAE